MKKIKILLLSLSLLVTFSIYAADLDVKYTNMKISGSNLVFDIEIKSNVGTTYLGGFEAYINYNTAAFGQSIANNVIVTPIGLTYAPAYSISKSNSSTSRLYVNAVNFFPNFFPASNVLTTYSKVLRISIPIVNANQNAGISSQCANMQSGQFYFPTAGGGTSANYTPVNCINDLINLPLSPNLNLIFSELGDPSNSSANFVEIYNAGTIAVDFSLYSYYLSVNNTNSMLLTGNLAVGGTYVIANNASDFNTAYPGKTYNLVSSFVGTTGTQQFLLSIFGDYVDGTGFDIYNGTLTGFDFSGKHAVRHFNIVNANMTPTASEWVLSDAQNTDMTPGSHRLALTWDGNPTSDWRSQGNWAAGFIPDAGHNVTIPNAGETKPVIGFGDNAYCHNLAIGGSGVGLYIESDQTNGDGSLITYGTVTGTASVQRFLDADRYWYVTKPVTSATANVFLHIWLFTYNEPTSSWNSFIEDETTPLVQMKGYAAWTSSINSWQYLDPVGDTTVSYDGVLNTGAISTSLTKGGNGYNFVGNPYPSAVDWESAGWTKTNLASNTCYFWVNTPPTYASYTVGSGGANGGTRFIPAAQGFFVQSSAVGTLGVTNDVRTHSTQDFYKSEENMLNRLSMTVSNGETNDETVIYFNENATAQLDYDYDAMKLMAPASPQAYTMMGTEKMAINTFNNSTETPAVTLGVNIPVAGDYTITASNIESFDASTPIFLEDVLTGQKINLRELNSYSFNSGEGTSERFVVHFAEYQGIGDGQASGINSIYAVDHTIYVDFSAVKGEIAIFNILGQETSRISAVNGLNKLTVPQGNAVYIVKVISDNTTVTKKVFVK
jgi:hypothetical protein